MLVFPHDRRYNHPIPNILLVGSFGNFQMTHTKWIKGVLLIGQNFLPSILEELEFRKKKMLILFTVFFFSHGEDGDEIQWHSEHQQSAEATAAHCVVCGVRSLHRTWITHGPRGGGLGVAVHKTRYTCVHILDLLQIISSMASGPRCHDFWYLWRR